MKPDRFLECRAVQLLGERDCQNDSYALAATCAFLADGAGGDPSARVLADCAVDYYSALPAQADALADELTNAPARFGDTLPPDVDGATTLAGVLLDSKGLLWTVCHGDSSVLHVRAGEILTLSQPHNFAAECALWDCPAPPDASGLLTRFLGRPSVGPSDISVSIPEPGDVIVLMSDGFAAHVPPQAAAMVAQRSRNPATLLRYLTRQLPETPDDNATCVVAVVRP